jgi:hypothetical protein
LPALRVTAYNVIPNATSPKSSFAGNGTYDIELPPGRYYLLAEDTRGYGAWQYSGHTSVKADAKVIEVTANGIVHGDDFVLQNGATFTGRATHGFKAFQSNVFVMRYDHNQWANVPFNSIDSRSDQGYFTLSGLPAGTYVLAADPGSTTPDAAAEFYPQKDTPAAARKFAVVAGQKVTANIFYRQGGRLNARVLQPDGRPAVGVQVQVLYQPAVDPEPSVGLRALEIPGVTLNANGSFALKGLSTGKYRIWVNGTATGQGQYLTIGGDPDSPTTTVAVTAARTTTVPATRLRLAGTLAVRAVDQAGQPVQGVRAMILDDYTDPSRDYVMPPYPGDPWITGADGVHSFGPQQVNAYHIWLVDPLGRFESTFYGGSKISQAVTVTPQIAQTTTFTVHLVPAIAQQLTRDVVTGSPIVGSTLTLHPGTYLPADVAMTYQWYSGSDDIAGATGLTYTVRPSDIGKHVGARVDLNNRGRLSGEGASLDDVIQPARSGK